MAKDPNPAAVKREFDEFKKDKAKVAQFSPQLRAVRAVAGRCGRRSGERMMKQLQSAQVSAKPIGHVWMTSQEFVGRNGFAALQAH